MNEERKQRTENLAIAGGSPVRSKPFPYRRLFGNAELEAVQKVFQRSIDDRKDFGFQEYEEDAYTKAFSTMLGGGYTDAVNSGSAALYVTLQALSLDKGSEVALSGVTDPGVLSAIVLNGLSTVLIDTAPDSFNVNLETVKRAVGPYTRVIILCHIGGIPICDIEDIALFCDTRGIIFIEDCSQVHGAYINERPVGTFGKASIFSTMFSKNHASGGCGGLVFTKDESFYWRVRSCADRGKPFNSPGFNAKDPRTFGGIGLNFNQDSLSCSIGLCTLRRIPSTMKRRADIVSIIHEGTIDCPAISKIPISPNVTPSYFFLTLKFINDAVTCSKALFFRSAVAEGLMCNPDYRYVVSEWPWAKSHITRHNTTPNATKFREDSFNLIFTEALNDKDAEDIVKILWKVYSVYKK